jgi:hypothetical protein
VPQNALLGLNLITLFKVGNLDMIFRFLVYSIALMRQMNDVSNRGAL